MYNRTLEIKRTLDGRVAPSESVIFNEQSISTPEISYDTATGEITFNIIGQYSVRWWVSTETTPKGAIEFALMSSQGDLTFAGSPQKTGQVSGFAAIDILTAGTTLYLINSTLTDNVFSREVVVKASLLILPIVSDAAGPTGADGRSAYQVAVDDGFVGTEEEWLASLVGPTGPQGDTGADGRSAYQVAVDDGFEGTEEEWLASLVGPTGPQGDTGPTGPTGSQGERGPIAATIPFCGKYGSYLGTDAQGEPLIVAFSGFGTQSDAEYLQEGEWANGTITMTENMNYGTAFIMPYDGILRNIYALFSTQWIEVFEDGSTIHPFVCLAVSNSDDLVYTILQNTMTYTEPYTGGVEHPRHTIRRGSLTNLNIEIAEGTLVAIVAGIKGENVTAEQYGQFSISGGLFLE